MFASNSYSSEFGAALHIDETQLLVVATTYI